jgi:hypothetical protein
MSKRNKVTLVPPDVKRHAWGRTKPFTPEWYEACNNAFVAQMRKYHPEREQSARQKHDNGS